MPRKTPAHEGAERLEQLSDERKRLHELLVEREKAKGSSQGAAGDTTGNASDAQPEWTPLVPIQPLGSKPPLFIVHAIRGSVFPYHHLALALGTDRPVYGLQSRGIDGKHLPIETNREMAEAYVAAMRKVQPHGPYHLAGYSMGGWIAYEMAVQLRAAGEEVALLAALGTPAPPGGKMQGAEAWRWIVKYNEDLFTLLRNSAMADNPELSKLHFGQNGFPNPFAAPGAAAAGGNAADANPFLAAMAQQMPGLRVSLTNVAAQLRYMAEPCDTGVDVFLTTEQSALYWADPSMGWRNLCGGEVTVHHLHGNHLDLFQQPRVQELARILAMRLDGERPTEGESAAV